MSRRARAGAPDGRLGGAAPGAPVRDRDARRVFFYPHRYLRDRQLDTIRSWPPHLVVNPELMASRTGSQVSREQSLAQDVAAARRRLKLPVINIKARPRGLPTGTIVYVWGALMLTGPYIVDLDNPYALTGYDLDALELYGPLVGRLLLQDRCCEIRCISAACRETLHVLFGEAVYRKAAVHYPRLPAVSPAEPGLGPECRFLFVSTQFEIKAGPTVLRAFQEVHRQHPECTLDVITHLPEEYASLVEACPGVRLHAARYSREEVWNRFMRNADVLVHPTMVESFGMIVLEALAHGLAVVATDVYALREMVKDGCNGVLLTPPLSIWDGYVPSREYHELSSIKQKIRDVDDSRLLSDLIEAMRRFVTDAEFRRRSRVASAQLFQERFA